MQGNATALLTADTARRGEPTRVRGEAAEAGADVPPFAPIVDPVIAAKADEYRAGKMGLLGFFVDQVMRQSGGNANSALVRQLERLGG